MDVTQDEEGVEDLLGDLPHALCQATNKRTGCAKNVHTGIVFFRPCSTAITVVVESILEVMVRWVNHFLPSLGLLLWLR